MNDNANTGNEIKVNRIPLLPGKESDWLTQMEVELRIMDCWELVNNEEAEPEEPDLEDHDEPAYLMYLRDLREHNHKNRMTFGLFSRSLAMRSDTIRKVRELSQFDGNAAAAWTFLKESYLVNSASTRLRLRTELHNLKMTGDDTLDSYKDKIVVLNAKYLSVNNNVGFGDEELLSTLLYGLDSRYETIVNLIEQLDNDVLEWNDVVRRLRNFENMNGNNQQSKNYNKNKSISVKEEIHTPLLMTRQQWINAESKSNNTNRRNNKKDNRNNRNFSGNNNNSNNNIKWCSFHKVNTHNDNECHYLTKKNNNPSRGNIMRSNVNNLDDTDTCLMLKCSEDLSQPSKQATSSSTSFYLDSAASKSYISNLSLFDTFSNGIFAQQVEIGDGSRISAKGKGQIGNFNNIYYAPDLAFNLMSLNDFSERGFTVEFSKNNCHILDGLKNRLLSISKGTDNLYSINIDQLRDLSNYIDSNISCNISDLPPAILESEIYGNSNAEVTPTENFINSPHIIGNFDELLISDAKDLNPSEVLHCRFGHANIPGILSSIRNRNVSGINFNISDIDPKYFCSKCPLGKSIVKPFSKDNHMHSDNKLDLIFTDLCGPYGTLSKGKNRFIITFTDNFSKYSWIYFLKNKSDAADKLKEFNVEVSALVGRKIHLIRSDSGGEFLSKDWINYCNQHDISLQYSSVYSPQQNGVAERLNRTLNDMARTLLISSGLSPTFWAEALKCASYIRNRISTSAHVNRKTPYEMLFDRVPNISNLRVFGCDAFVHIPIHKKNKLGPKARKGTFIGYEDNSPMYKVLMWDSMKVERSRNVTFDEGSFTRGKVRLMDINVNPFLCTTTDTYIDPFPSTTDTTEETSSTSGSTTTESISNLDLKDSSIIRKSPRVSVPPERLTYDKLGFLNLAFNDVWKCNVLNTLVDYVEHALLSVNFTPTSYKDAIHDTNSTLWIKAINEELRALESLNTWTIIDGLAVHPHNILSTKWVFKLKEDENGIVTKYKARLVVKGYEQQKGVDFFDTFSPVARLSSIRTLLSVATKLGMHIHQMDVNTAFVNAVVNEDIFVQCPDGLVIPPNHLLKLNKALYGLKQAPREWNSTIHAFIISLGFQRSKADACIYMKKSEDILIYFALYVDDILLACTSEAIINEHKQQITNRYSVKDLGVIKYFLGLQIDRDMMNNTITINQSHFIDRILDRFGFSNCNPSNTPSNISIKLTSEMSIKNEEDDTLMKKTPYREAVGSLMYLMIGTRPDLAYAVSNVSRFMEHPGPAHWNAVKQIFRYLKGTSRQTIRYGRSTDTDNNIIAYCDADWAGDSDSCRSTTGYVTFYNHGPITWNSRLQPTIAKSSTEAEYIGLSTACDEVVWLRQLLLDLDQLPNEPTIIFEDNQSAIDLSYNPIHHKRTKHINVRFHSIREKIQEGVIQVKHISTDLQLADLLTKPLSKIRFNKLMNAIFMNAV